MKNKIFKQEAKLSLVKLKNKPTLKEEANALTAYCFRNTKLEDYHSKGLPITQKRMKALMIEASEKVEVWLNMKEKYQTNKKDNQYNQLVNLFTNTYCSKWKK